MKIKRQRKILDIIENKEIETQDELVQELEQAGFVVTQATISRDIRELYLTKTTGKSGKLCYSLPVNRINSITEKYDRILKEGFISCVAAKNLVIIKTAPGIAMAVAASLDSMEWDELLGCIAGDDTIFCATHTDEEAVIVSNRIKEIAG